MFTKIAFDRDDRNRRRTSITCIDRKCHVYRKSIFKSDVQKQNLKTTIERFAAVKKDNAANFIIFYQLWGQIRSRTQLMWFSFIFVCREIILCTAISVNSLGALAYISTFC
jgi:CRISPR/Cas system-associated endoribonuclease Cas2